MNGDIRSSFFRKGYVRVVNSSGATIPPCSVVLITSATKSNGEIVYTVRQPNASAAEFHWDGYLITWPIAIGSGATNEGMASPATDPVYARYGTGTPAFGEVWGPKHAQFTLAEDYYGFSIQGHNTTIAGNSVTLVKWIGVHTILGKIDDTNVSLDATNCSVSVWDGAGAGDTGMAVTAHDRAVALTSVSGKFCGVSRNAGTPTLMWVRCT